MSYSFTMHFTVCDTKEGAFELARQFCNICFQCREVLIRNKYIHAPSKRNTENWHINRQALKEADKYWLSSLLTHHFVMWQPQDNYGKVLLALVDKDYPGEVLRMFPANILFQNGTDQDYEYSYYGDKIPLFSNIRSQVLSIPDEQLCKFWNDLEDDSRTEEEIQKNPEYFRKTAVYRRIFRALDLDNWIYNEDGNFEVFSMCSLTSNKRILDARASLGHVLLRKSDII